MGKNQFFLSIISIAIGLLTLFSYQQVSFASEFNFAVTTHLPDNQVDKSHSYFDLKVDPGSEQTVTISLRNDTSKDVIVDAQVARASTGMSGTVQYSSTDVKDINSVMDKSFNNDIVKAVSIPKEITIPKKSTVDVPVEVKAPAAAFKGIMAGGITFTQTNLKDSQPSTGGTTIQNKYSYTVGVVLRNTLTAVTPDLKLGDVSVDQFNYRTAIIAPVHNITSTYINHVAVQGAITKRGSSHQLYRVNITVDKNHLGKQIAPNSIYRLPFYLGGDKLKGGKYTLDLTMISRGHKWHFKQNFTILDSKAKDLNKTDVDTMRIDWKLITGILILIFVVIVILLYIIKKYRGKSDEKK